jgi:hypothetical protein
MNIEDYYVQGRRSWVRLHEKGGKRHDVPAHHLLETYIDEYLTETGIASDKDTPLFRTAAGKTGTLTDRRMTLWISLTFPSTAESLAKTSILAFTRRVPHDPIVDLRPST